MLPRILYDWIEIVFLGFRGFPGKSMGKHTGTVTTIAFDFIGSSPMSGACTFHTRARTHVGTHAYTVFSLFPYTCCGCSFSRGTRTM